MVVLVLVCITNDLYTLETRKLLRAFHETVCGKRELGDVETCEAFSCGWVNLNCVEQGFYRFWRWVQFSQQQPSMNSPATMLFQDLKVSTAFSNSFHVKLTLFCGMKNSLKPLVLSSSCPWSGLWSSNKKRANKRPVWITTGVISGFP